MFHPIEIPFESVMLFNLIRLKPGTDMDDVEMALGEMCNVVKETYGNENGRARTSIAYYSQATFITARR